MPTVPMFIQHAQPTNASHGVFAPGGYEWWHFDAEDGGGNVVTIDVCNGCPFHPEYVKRYQRYLKSPTRTRPPVPGDFPCVSACLYEQDRRTAGFHVVLPAGGLVASRERLELVAGANTVRVRGDGSTGVSIAGPAGTLSAELTFRPIGSFAAWEGEVSGSADAEVHRWVLVDPLCGVEGEVVAGEQRRIVKVRGWGFRDYAYGTRPMDVDLRGRVLAEDRFVAFRMKGGIVQGHDGRVERAAAPSGFGPIEVEGVCRMGAPLSMGQTAHGELVMYRGDYAGMRRTGIGEVLGASLGATD